MSPWLGQTKENVQNYKAGTVVGGGLGSVAWCEGDIESSCVRWRIIRCGLQSSRRY